MKRIKVLLAALLVFAMMAPMALADDGPTNSQSTSIVGKGTYANPATASVWSIEFPTAAKLGFTVDPKKMVKGSGMYSEEVDIKDGTVLFPWYNEENTLTKMDVTSDEIKVRNMGTSEVTVELNIRPTDCGMIIRSEAFAASPTDKDASILLQAAVNATSPTYQIISAAGTNLSTTLKTNYQTTETGKQDPFQAKYNSATGEMTMGYKEGVEVGTFDWESVSFKLKGETNPSANADWSKKDLTAPNLEFTWNVRNSAAEAIKVEFDSSITPANYVWAADCLYAVPGQTVNVYVKPKEADDASPLGYWIDPTKPAEQPGVIKTSIKELSGEIKDDSTGDEYVKFSNGVVGDNGTIRYTFAVPSKEGPAAFTMKTSTGADNKITITQGPTIKKVTSTAQLDAIGS